jgi:hypothetical protein
MIAFYIIGYLSLFLSVVAAFTAVKRNKALPLLIGFVLLVVACFILWMLEQ